MLLSKNYYLFMFVLSLVAMLVITAIGMIGKNAIVIVAGIPGLILAALYMYTMYRKASS
jgi:succinate-acetate transporter protein